ncbi:F0F1 ATP synthase subunit A [bacterium]|nr:F0F1 ATP synthase subunit A [bacterium]
MLPLAEEKEWMTDHLLKVHPYPFLELIGISPHVLSMFVAAAAMLVIFPRIARDDSLVPRGLRNFFEVILVFVKEEVARPFLGHNTERFIPVLWTFFFYILFCNLIGLIPGMATATGNYFVTATLAFTAFIWWHACGIWEQGLFPYIKNIVPPGLPLALIPFLFLIECIGHIVKPCALTIRLFANMTGGHAVLYGFLGLIFIFQSYLVAPVSVAAAVGVYLLEIFVAFVQAYVFTFLVTVFLGSAVHPEH